MTQQPSPIGAQQRSPFDPSIAQAEHNVVTMRNASIIIGRLTNNFKSDFVTLEHGSKLVVTAYASIYNEAGGALNRAGMGFVRELANSSDNACRHYVLSVMANINDIMAAPTVRTKLEGQQPSGKASRKKKNAA